jgi:hypothetical protein
MWTQTLQSVINQNDRDEAKAIIESLVDVEGMELTASLSKHDDGLLITIKGIFTKQQIAIINTEFIDLCEIELTEEAF